MATTLPTEESDAGFSSRTSKSAEESGQRGHLVVADRVVEKIAAQCASEITGIGGGEGGFLGMGKHADLDARPKVDVELTGNIASLSVEIGVEYPRSIEQAAQTVRDQLRRRVSDLAGVDVRQVDIRVKYLVPQRGGQERILL